MFVKADRENGEIVRDEGKICFRFFSLIFIFFASHHLPPCLIYTHTHPNLWSGEQNRDGRWSRILSELLAAHLLQSRQKDMSHKGPNSPDLYLVITHFLPCQYANCLSDHTAFIQSNSVCTCWGWQKVEEISRDQFVVGFCTFLLCPLQAT